MLPHALLEHDPISFRWELTKLEKLFRKSRLFTWQLRGENPVLPLVTLSDPWRGAEKNSKQVSQHPSTDNTNNPDYHTFEWVRDVREAGGGTGRGLVRTHLTHWMAQNRSWSAVSWRPDIIGKRLSALLFCYGWFGDSADESFQTAFAASLALQARCLALDWQRMPTGTAQLSALRGLIIAQAILYKSARDVEALCNLIVPKIKFQLYQDGGHKSRQPEQHLEVMRIILECRMALAHVGQIDFPVFDEIIPQMAAIAKIWRHGNGQFAQFNLAGSSSVDDINQVLSRVSGRTRSIQHAPETGFSRLSSGRNTLICDTGSSHNAETNICASTSAFEFSVGSHMLIVNSGQTSSDMRLNAVLRQTAAHSALTLDGLDNEAASKNRFARVIDCDVGPATGGSLISLTHGGYERSHGLLHSRQLFLAMGGGNLRGQDKLTYTNAPGEIPSEAIIRFHLHPGVSAAMIRGGHILLKIRGQNAGWVFKSKGGRVSLDTSLYINEGRRMSCQQIVLRSTADQIQMVGSLVVNWAFQRSLKI